MFLSELIHKSIFSANTFRGVCLGIGVSAKNYAVKYLLCANEPGYLSQKPTIDFAVNYSPNIRLEENKLFFSSLRTVATKNCAKLFLGLPIYTHNGDFLGYLYDVELNNHCAVRVFTDKGTFYPFSCISAVSDAIILRKTQPYPLGQRIPAPIAGVEKTKNETLVTRPVLQKAIKGKNLIKLTLSLSPFDLSV